ncbi:hypothetical protein BDZ89DRAFT_452934 [Hymenopellis radicata]|nr:hypothetical protein BDZ89DRAFT_452934 [Hymenopellis radicata]
MSQSVLPLPPFKVFRVFTQPLPRIPDPQFANPSGKQLEQVTPTPFHSDHTVSCYTHPWIRRRDALGLDYHISLEASYDHPAIFREERAFNYVTLLDRRVSKCYATDNPTYPSLTRRRAARTQHYGGFHMLSDCVPYHLNLLSAYYGTPDRLDYNSL